MKEEKFNEIVNKYGREICSANLRSPERSKAYLYADENNYPYIAVTNSLKSAAPRSLTTDFLTANFHTHPRQCDARLSGTFLKKAATT